MPQVEVVIGGRSFEVACQPGEEPFLLSAAELLDAEASSLSEQVRRMPESRMLLMAALMLADKTAGLEERVRDLEARSHELEGLAADAQARARIAPQTVEVPVEVPIEVRVEVPVVPHEVAEMMADLAAEAEALARSVEALVPPAAA